MARRPHFQTPRWQRPPPVPASIRQDRDGFMGLLNRRVARRFTRLTGLRVVVFPLELPSPPGILRLILPPAHPECAGHAGSTECGREWQEHRKLPRRRPVTHSHQCPFNKLCAVVPVVWRGRCLAACKLVCPAELAQADFDHHVEVLDLLSGAFVREISSWLSRWVTAEKPVRRASSKRPPPKRSRVSRQAHGHVTRVLEFVQEHYQETGLKVKDIGPALGFESSDYLANQFVHLRGERLHDHLLNRRLEHAQTLLVSTHLPIAGVAFRSGFAHEKWFRHVFRERVGVAPGVFRKNLPSAAGNFTLKT